MLKGAGREVRNAKDAAGKQEGKAKTAVHDRPLRDASAMKMKEERNEAVAEAQSLRKLCEDLRAELDVEHSGRLHLRCLDSALDMSTVVIPWSLQSTVHTSSNYHQPSSRTRSASPSNCNNGTMIGRSRRSRPGR